jgi:hypothetical protein
MVNISKGVVGCAGGAMQIPKLVDCSVGCKRGQAAANASGMFKPNGNHGMLITAISSAGMLWLVIPPCGSVPGQVSILVLKYSCQY